MKMFMVVVVLLLAACTNSKDLEIKRLIADFESKLEDPVLKHEDPAPTCEEILRCGWKCTELSGPENRACSRKCMFRNAHPDDLDMLNQILGCVNTCLDLCPRFDKATCNKCWDVCRELADQCRAKKD